MRGFWHMRWRLLAALGLTVLATSGVARADVRAVVGPTPIPGGEARAAADITLINEKLAVAIAVQSPVPYGVPRGAIVDVAPVRDGKIGHDQMVFADFIPNSWSAWPNSYRKVEFLQRDAQQVRVRAIRDWGKVIITTVYTLRANSDQLEIQTTMNNGGNAAVPQLLSGMTLWPKGGYVFAVPGLGEIDKGKADGALSDRVVAYDEDWAIALHSEDFDHVAYGTKDLYKAQSLAPGESRDFHGWLQVSPSGDLSAIIGAEIARLHLRAGTIRGAVTGRGAASLDRPVIVIEKPGQLHGWVFGHQGRYELTLPAGDYSLYATAKNFARSDKQAVTIAAGVVATRDFRDLEGRGRIQFAVSEQSSGQALDARIVIREVWRPQVEFLGRRTFFTDLDAKGRCELPIAAGLDLLFVSDHDTTINLAALQAIADKRGMPFMGGIELSPSWGHFNAYPLTSDAVLKIDTSTANTEELLREARRLGARVIQSNHPFLEDGYFANIAAGLAPGRFTPAFDLIEINAADVSNDQKVLHQLSKFWNEGHRFYLTAGTDTHDVWNLESGRVRAFAHIDGKPTAAAFTLSFDVQSVAGVDHVELVSDGVPVKTESFSAKDVHEVHVEFPLTARRSSWYALVVEDRQGKHAYSDPIWLETLESP